MTSSKTPHVLWIPSWYPDENNPLNGIFFKEQAEILSSNGLKIGVAYPSIYYLREINFQNLSSHRFQTVCSCNQGLKTLVYNGWYPFIKLQKMKLKWWVSKAMHLTETYITLYGKPDIIHAQSSLWAGCAAETAAEKYGIPYIITEHSTQFLSAQSSINKYDLKKAESAFKQARGIVAVSNFLKENLKNNFSTNTDIKVIHNPIDCRIFSLPKSPKSGPFRFLFLGFHNERKNIALLIHAFRIVLSKIPHAVLEIGGDGPLRPDNERLVKELNVTKNVFFTGTLTRAQTVKAYHRSHAFVLPSKKETFGIVLVEALATGIPVIATNNGGSADIVTDGMGRITSHCCNSLANAMIEIYENYDAYSPSKIRNFAQTNFDCPHFASQYKNLYLSLLNESVETSVTECLSPS